MKKILLAIVAVAGAMLLSAEMPRSEWHAKVGDCALDPDALKATISQLSSDDKTAFLAEVNAAIDKMPGSAEAKAAKFLAANRAAVAGAGASDRAAVLAEVFATVPPEALTVISEEFAKNEFARPGTMTPDEFTNIVAQTMAKITQRTASAESGAVRAGFAGIMFVRASGAAPEAVSSALADGSAAAAAGGDTALAANVIDAVVSSLPADAQGDAKSSWIPSAVGQEGAPSYDSMLASSSAGEEPNAAAVVAITPSQTVDSMLGDLQAKTSTSGETSTVPGSNVAGANNTATSDPMSKPTGTPRDRVLDPSSPYYSGKTRGDEGGGGTVVPVEPSEPDVPEPQPYWMQGL